MHYTPTTGFSICSSVLWALKSVFIGTIHKNTTEQHPQAKAATIPTSNQRSRYVGLICPSHINRQLNLLVYHWQRAGCNDIPFSETSLWYLVCHLSLALNCTTITKDVQWWLSIKIIDSLHTSFQCFQLCGWQSKHEYKYMFIFIFIHAYLHFLHIFMLHKFRRSPKLCLILHIIFYIFYVYIGLCSIV